MYKRVMDKLEDTIASKLSPSDPSKPISEELKLRFGKQLLEFSSKFKTPTHPTYHFMIQNAIRELNEEGGSTEESISEFIKQEYKDLPWAHTGFLSHHLRKLSMNGVIVCKKNGCYMITNDCADCGNTEEVGHKMGIRSHKGRQMNSLKSPIAIALNNLRQNDAIGEQEDLQMRQIVVTNTKQKGDLHEETFLDAIIPTIQPLYPIAALNDKEPNIAIKEQNYQHFLNDVVPANQSLDSDDSTFSLNEPYIDQEQQMENSPNSGAMQLPKYNISVTRVDEEKKIYLRLKRQQPERNPLETTSNVGAIKSGALRINFKNRGGNSEKPCASVDESLRLEKHYYQSKNSGEERNNHIVCGLPAQQVPEPKFRGRNKRKLSFPI